MIETVLPARDWVRMLALIAALLCAIFMHSNAKPAVRPSVIAAYTSTQRSRTHGSLSRQKGARSDDLHNQATDIL